RRLRAQVPRSERRGVRSLPPGLDRHQVGSAMLSRADHIGSLLRPRNLREAFRRHSTGQSTQGELRAAQDEAIRHVVKLQHDCGMEIITDGEFRRISYWEKFVRL